MILGASSVKEASYCPMPILGAQSCELENGTSCAEMLLAAYLETGEFLGQSNSLSNSPHHIRSFEVTVGMVWSQETGACAGSVRYPPSWVTTKNK